MKVNIDFGTQENIPPRLLAHLVDIIRSGVDSLDDNSYTLSKVTMYLNFYDDNGNLVEVGDEYGHELNYNFRTLPYKIKRKNVMEPVTIFKRDDEGEVETCGYLYPYYKE